MNRYVIIEIVDNQTDYPERVLIVKANPVEEPKGFDYLSKLFGKSYFTFTEYETENTEIFVIPFSNKTLSGLINLSNKTDDERFWMPNISQYTKKDISWNNNEKRTVWLFNSLNRSFDVSNYPTPYLRTNKKENLFAYPIISHGDEELRYFSCIPYNGTPFSIENEVVNNEDSEYGILLHYITGDNMCSIYGYEINDMYNERFSHRIVFFKGLALDYIIKLYPKAVGAFSIIPGGIIENNKEHCFTFIITEDKFTPDLPQNFSIDAYKQSLSPNLINLRRTDILLVLLSTYYGYSLKDLSENFNWNIFKSRDIDSKEEQEILNYLYPNEYPSVYTEEEICYAEFINNCICIANVNNYSHGMDADTLIKNYNRIINYLKAFPSFLSNVPLMQEVYVARGIYFTASHFNDSRINGFLFISAFYILSKAISNTRLVFLNYLRYSLLEERYDAAFSIISELFPYADNEEIEDKINDILITDYLIVKKYIPNYISDRSISAQKCRNIISNQYCDYSSQQIINYLSNILEETIEATNNYVKSFQYSKLVKE